MKRSLGKKTSRANFDRKRDGLFGVMPKARKETGA